MFSVDLKDYRYLTVTSGNGATYTLTLDDIELDEEEATVRVVSKYEVKAKSTWTLDS